MLGAAVGTVAAEDVEAGVGIRVPVVALGVTPHERGLACRSVDVAGDRAVLFAGDRPALALQVPVHQRPLGVRGDLDARSAGCTG